MASIIPTCTDLGIFAMVMIFGSLVLMTIAGAYAIKHRQELRKKNSSGTDSGMSSNVAQG
jgi:hypothetical protein